MFVLVIKSEASSIWFQLWRMPAEELLINGRVLKITLAGSHIEYRVGTNRCYGQYEIRNHAEAMHRIADALLLQFGGVLHSLSEISAVGHFIPHGGSELTEPTVITPAVKEIITKYIAMPPYKNICALAGIEAGETEFPNAMQIGVFDTSYSQSLAPKARRYALPSEYSNMNIWRYGVHGVTHQFAAQKALDFLNITPTEQRMIICNLGNEVSISGNIGSKCVDISNGFSCFEGPMSARSCGACDPTLISYISDQTGKNIQEIIDSLTRKAGLAGVCNYVADMRDILYLVEKEDPQTKLAWDMYVYGIQKCIASFTAPLQGIDILVLTGRHGEAFPRLREEVLSAFGYLGVELDHHVNREYHGRKHEPCVISSCKSKIKVLIIPENDELAIAQATYTLAANLEMQ